MADNPLEEGEQKLKSTIKSEPWFVWAGAAAAAGIIVYFVWKRKATASSSTTSASSQSTDPVNGYAIDSMAGLPYGSEAGGYNYQAGPVDNYPGGFSEVGVNGNNYPIIPFGDTPIYDSNGNLVGFQQPNPNPTSPNPTPTPTPPPTPTPKTFTITAAYEKAHPKGTLHAIAEQFGITYDNLYAANKTLLGSDPNHAKFKVGDVLTIPAHDGPIMTPFTSGQGGGSIPVGGAGYGGGSIPVESGGQGAGGFHLAVNAGRNTMDQWAFANGMHQGFDSFAPVGE